MEYYRRNLYVLCVTIFLAAVSWSQVLPFLPLFLKEIGVTHNLRQWSGTIFAAQSLAAIITLPFWGKMGDKYGQKKMTIRAGVCLVGIYFAMSFCHEAWQLAVLRFLNGALTGFIPSSIALIATNTPKEHASRSVATAQTAGAAGSIVGPAIGGLLALLFGYRVSMRVSGFAVLFSVILVYRLVRVTKKPEPAEKTSLLEDFKISLRSPVLRSTMFAVLVCRAFFEAVQPLLALHIGDLSNKAPIWFTGVVFSLPSIAFLLSAHRWNSFGEKRGYRYAIRMGMIGAVLSAIGLALSRDIWLFSAFYFAAGVSLASINPSAGAIVCNRVEESFRGRAYGMLYSATTLGAFVAPLTAGNIAAATSIPTVFALSGLMLLVGVMWFRKMSRKWPLQSETV